MTWVHLMGISSIHDHMKGGYGHMIYLVFDGVIDDFCSTTLFTSTRDREEDEHILSLRSS